MHYVKLVVDSHACSSVLCLSPTGAEGRYAAHADGSQHKAQPAVRQRLRDRFSELQGDDQVQEPDATFEQKGRRLGWWWAGGTRAATAARLFVNRVGRKIDGVRHFLRWYLEVGSEKLRV